MRRRGGRFTVDAYDWGFCWRSWDALRSCAYTGRQCAYALGDTPQNRHIGTWSDGTPIVGLKIRTRAPSARCRCRPARPRARPDPDLRVGVQRPDVPDALRLPAAGDRHASSQGGGERPRFSGARARRAPPRPRRPWPGPQRAGRGIRCPPGRRPAPAPGRAARPPPARAPSSARDPARRPPRLDGLPGRGRADSQAALSPGWGWAQAGGRWSAHVHHQQPLRRHRLDDRADPRGRAYATAASQSGSSAKTANPNEQALTGETADKVKAAALQKLPGATILRVETDDGGVYEAHVRKSDGTEAEVHVDKDFAVTSVDTRPAGGRGGHGPGGRGGGHLDTAALAKSLGVTEAKLQAALDATRPAKGDRGDKRGEMAAAIAKALGESTADVQAVLDANRPAPRPAARPSSGRPSPISTRSSRRPWPRSSGSPRRRPRRRSTRRAPTATRAPPSSPPRWPSSSGSTPTR